MPTASEIHVVNVDEINHTIKLGFLINGLSVYKMALFINTNFTGFDLFAFALEIHGLLSPLTDSAIHKVIETIDEPPPILGFRYYSANYKDSAFGLLFSRTFIKDIDQIIVSHDYLVLPEISRGKKIGKQILACCLRQYINIGVSRIRVHAGLEDGGYVWAKVGFKAVDKGEMMRILKEAERLLSPNDYQIVKVWYDDYYNNNPSGAAFNIEDWARLDSMQKILRGSNWHGEIDLTNQEELSNFKNYVTR